MKPVGYTPCCSTDAVLLLLLLSYHRRVRMVTEALEQCVEVGRVSHRWCVSIIGHGYGGAGIEVVDGMHV